MYFIEQKLFDRIMFRKEACKQALKKIYDIFQKVGHFLSLRINSYIYFSSISLTLLQCQMFHSTTNNLDNIIK